MMSLNDKLELTGLSGKDLKNESPPEYTTKREFFEANRELDVDYLAEAMTLAPGEAFVIDLGAGGGWRVRCVEGETPNLQTVRPSMVELLASIHEAVDGLEEDPRVLAHLKVLDADLWDFVDWLRAQDKEE